MNKEEIILGTKVKCKGYFKKKDIHEYIYANKKHFYRVNGNNIIQESEPSFYLSDLGDRELYLPTKEFVEKEFIGIVVGRKEVSIENHYEQAYQDIFDPFTFGYIDTNYVDSVIVRKARYITCCQVFYAMGKSRLVPITQIEILKGE